MNTEDLKLLALRFRVVLEEVMDITDVIISRGWLAFRGSFKFPLESVSQWIRSRLKNTGYVPMIVKEGGEYELRILPEVAAEPSNPLTNLLLFIATLGSTLFVGAQMAGVNVISQPHKIFSGIPFSFTILAILIVHEFGHYTVSRFHGVRTTLPYFIPAPTIIGTFGAVIKTKSYIPGRKSLLDIGAAGPICGFLVAVVAMVVGLARSEVVDLEPVLRGGGLEFGDSLLIKAATYLIKGPLPPTKTVLLDPIAFAAWVGLLVTAINLLPIGQLDGGHVMYALAGRWHETIARIIIGGLLVMGYFWPGWYFIIFLVLLLGYRHSPPLDDVTPIDAGRKLVAVAAILIFVLCIVPVPVKIHSPASLL